MPVEPAAAVADGADPVLARVLEVVAASTGYPSDMLDAELDLEADLGIDTVKQAEIFANIRESYGIERDDKLKLRDYPTLAHVVGFVHDHAPQTNAPAPTATATAPAPTEPAPVAPVEPAAAVADGADPVLARVLEVVAASTGYPSDMLDAELDLEADLGIDTVKQAEIFANIRESYDIERDDKLKLRDYPTLAHVVGFVHDHAPQTNAPAPTATAPTEPAPAPTEPAPVAPVEPAAAVADGADPVLARVLEVVAANTGYPPDMLDAELDLEADLGIDTVKQAEIFANIRESYDIERDDKLKLRDYPTLAHVVGFVHDHAPQTNMPASTEAAPATAEAAPRDHRGGAERLPAAGTGRGVTPTAGVVCAHGRRAGPGEPGRRDARPWRRRRLAHHAPGEARRRDARARRCPYGR